MKIFSLIFSLLLISVSLSCSKNDKKAERVQLKTNNDYRFFVIENDSIKIHRDDKIVDQTGDSVNGQLTIKGRHGGKSIVYYQKGWKTKKDYFSSDSLIKSQYHYSQNKFNGKYTEWYENGNLKIKGRYLMGKADSLWTYYYPNGKIQSKGFFNSKYKNTENIEFIEHTYDYDTGEEMEFTYSTSEYSFDGIWKFYDLSGQIVQELEFSNGKITSFHIGKPEY
jgi:antitoxin component YwqK of YwqJK toxin-antitoxin module